MPHGLGACPSDPSGQGCPRNQANGRRMRAQFFLGRLNAHVSGHTRGTFAGLHANRDVSQFQATATKSVRACSGGRRLWCSSLRLALMHVHEMPKKSDLQDREPRRRSRWPRARPTPTARHGVTGLAARLDYNNAIGGSEPVPVCPVAARRQRKQPRPRSARSSTIRTALLHWEYARTTSAAGRLISATHGTPARRNELSDRDFVSASVKYSF